jgi:nucleoid DNA-binding protein
MAMTRQQFARQLQDGLNTVFGMSYNEWDSVYDKIFSVVTSDKAYEEDVLLVGLGGGSVKAEGAAVV